MKAKPEDAKAPKNLRIVGEAPVGRLNARRIYR